MAGVWRRALRALTNGVLVFRLVGRGQPFPGRLRGSIAGHRGFVAVRDYKGDVIMDAYLSKLAAAVSVGQHIVLSQPRPNKGPELHFYRVTGIDGVRVSVEPVGRHLLWGVRDWDLPNYSQSAGDQVASDELSRRQDCGIAIGGLRDLASWRTWPAEIPPLVPMDPREEVAHGFDLGSRPYFVQGQGDGRFALGPLL